MKLIIEDDEGRKTVVPFLREEITIGRQEGNTIRLTERNVSRRHCRLIRNNGSIFVEDLGSYNGVKVNGDKIEGKQPIKPGDLIEVGDYDLAIEGDPGHAHEGKPSGPIAAGPDDPDGKATARMTLPPEIPSPPPTAPLSMAPTRSAAGPQAPHKFEPTSVIKAPVPHAGVAVEEVPAAEAPRLVALTTEHAGREFVLDKTVISVGKGSENDVAVEHRSVSRVHCQLVREQDGSWKVLDLQSANGVKVNGEQYGEAPLRPGDTLQLGHLRFRFVAPGELFQFVPETATALNQAPASSSSKLPMIAGGVGLLLVLGLGGAWLGGLFDGGAKPKPGASVATAPKVEPKVEAPVAVEPPPPEVPPNPVVEPPPLIAGGAKELAEAEQLFSQQKWEAAATAADAAVAAGGGDKAQALADKARAEQASAAALDAGTKAIGKGDGEGALDELEKIAADSSYQTKAKAQRMRAGLLYGQAVAKNARALARARKFDEAIQALDVADARIPNDPSVSKAREEVEKLQSASTVVASARPEPRDRKSPGDGGRKDPSPADEEAGKGAGDEDSASTRRDDAKRAFETGVGLASKGQCKQAIPAFHKSLELNPALAESHKYLGTCYAQLGDGDNGAKHYRKFLELQPNHPQAPQIRKILEQYEQYKNEKKGP